MLKKKDKDIEYLLAKIKELEARLEELEQKLNPKTF